MLSRLHGIAASNASMHRSPMIGALAQRLGGSASTRPTCASQPMPSSACWARFASSPQKSCARQCERDRRMHRLFTNS